MRTIGVLGVVLVIAVGLAGRARAQASGSESESESASGTGSGSASGFLPVSSLPRARPSGARLVGQGLAGGAIGALLGAASALLLNLAIGCDDGEGWVSGFSCDAGWGFAVATGALAAAPIGMVISLAISDAEREQHGDLWLAVAGAGLGVGIGGGIVATLVATTDEPTLSVAVGGLSGVLIAALASPLLYAGSRPDSAGQRPTLRVSPFGLSASF